ncbi:1-acyl-sn-glycerol-3-phosphate acyltransferase [uncultured Thiohalocapsa sp.]|uniref:lysophospholipid acyltransferase family protein n=1 Tax=uncultured Thiohalocapsa sp. TaxID=768990 RepID=UPI0025F405F3|nr:lysophospholipid acyltransferase family protein [uncultured Thiohalocapsa sp.]
MNSAKRLLLKLIPRLIPIWRALRLGEHLLTGAMLGAGVALLHRLNASPPWLSALVAWWHRRLCHCLGLSVSCRGSAAAGALVAANHVSWLDISVLGGAAPMRFVSKADVRRWPLVGWLAELAGTLFLPRGAHRATSIAREIALLLQAGERVALFPEGTTGTGHTLLHFHARLFAAVDASSMPVQPVAIHYGCGPKPDTVAPFVGDDTLIAHLGRILRHPQLSVTLTFLPPVLSPTGSRRELAEATRTAIDDELRRRRRGTDAATAQATPLAAKAA